MVDNHYLRYLAPGFDREAVLEQLMTEYGDDVWNFAYFLTQRRDMADDIAQDVFLIVYNRLYTFRGESSLKSWLLSIARNKSLNYLRNAFIRKTILTNSFKRTDTSASAEQVALKQLASREVWEKVLELPRKHREVIVLAYHYELTMNEIAVTLDLSEGTVKSRLSRAKQKMAALMKEAADREVD